MSATVFCTFDQQDLADLAMGKLRNSITGIHSIQYLEGSGQGHSGSRGYDLVPGWGLFNSTYSFPGVTPSHPVSIKIVCDDTAKNLVASKLVNLHAYRIVAS